MTDQPAATSARSDLTESADRKLVLLRHAKSAWPDVPDHERPLARRGRRNAPTMGRWLRAAGHVPDQVVCSTARRARETWQLAQGGLGAAPPVSFEDRVYEASAAQLLDLIHGAPPGARTLLIVGHDPGIPGLALMLAGNPPPASSGPADGTVPHAAVDRMRAKFPTAAVAVLEITGSWVQLGSRTARLACFVTPREIESTRNAAANDR
jgi:phosphohistidine phosphatase